MFVKEISLDGFKSYAQRVDINGFDPQFNAITGLNGSGKSNILDSICFVLGIQNLQQVRANSLQELVYKQGQAGVTKATVSIVFDNSDKENSPVGYDHFDEITVTRQLVIGGRSKYLINGRTAEPTRVQNLFHSVQLNVNNPHFLIMQGRITKVLNMKPPEILGLLEEAAGTKMYETKKQAALRTLEKKQIKVDEINKILSEDIMPALEKLRKEKVQYMEWQNASSKMERLQRFCVAYKYTEAQALLKDGEGEVAKAIETLNDVDSQLQECENRLMSKDEDIKSLQKEKESKSEGEIKELTRDTDSLAKRLVQENSKLENIQEGLQNEKDQVEQLKKSLEELNEKVVAEKIRAATTKRDEANAEVEKAQAAVAAAQNELAGAEAGDGRDASNRSLHEQLADAKNGKTEAEGEAKAAQTLVKHCKKRLQDAKKELGMKQKGGSKLEDELKKEQAAVAQLQSKLESLDFDADKAKEIEAKMEEKQTIIREISDMVDQLSSQVAAAEFYFKDPERGFDRSKVKGVVAKLVRVSDPKYSSALEVAAGGKLYQVVVDNERTAKALLSGGQLRNRVTIIPLNKVSAKVLPDQAKLAANQLAAGKAQPAIELVGYENELTAAMQYVFGSSFICEDSTTARKLAFHKDVASRCVTLDGDDFNPSGTLTGGSRNKTNSILKQLHALASYEADLNSHRSELQKLAAELKNITKQKSDHQRFTKELELKTHSLNLLQKRIEGSEVHQLTQAVAECEAQCEAAESAVEQARQKQVELEDLARSLENQIANFDKEKGKRIKEAKSKVQDAKMAVEAAKAAARNKEAALQEVIAESEGATSERSSINEQIQQSEKSILKMENEVEELSSLIESIRMKHDDLSAELEERRARLRDCDEEISQITKDKAALNQQVTDLVVEKKKINNRIEALKKGAHTAEDKCHALEREYPWIQTEMSHFGTPGSDYDWEANDPTEMFEEYEKARHTIDALSKRVNKKVMQMFEKAEHEYNELKRKKDVVENDKFKIREVMDELDEKKREALKTTWTKVNGDLGSIFSTLLPGTMAKLEPVEGATFMDGLEVKVAFGGVWKETLSELSGGQKSLLALSLILAMLLFKPAPIYILDEVDAALDLSHTQNIGRMIKSHFPQSQFIVVSLKEGMFNNANVIFRTKFIDGVSTVTRTINRMDESRGSKQVTKQRPALKENVRA